MSTRGPRNHKKPMNHCNNTVVGDYNRSRGSQWGSGTLKGSRNHNGAWYHDGGLGNTRGPGTKMCSGIHIVPQWSSGTKTGTQATQPTLQKNIFLPSEKRFFHNQKTFCKNIFMTFICRGFLPSLERLF